MALLFGGCTVQSLRDPCFFDPPPGDQLTRSIGNDTDQAVALVQCDDERCDTGYNSVIAPAHGTAEVIVEGCEIQTVAVADPNTLTVLGCLTERGDNLTSATAASNRRVSLRHACAGPHTAPFNVTLQASSYKA